MGAEVIRQVTVRLPQWSGIELTAVHTPDGVFFPIRYLCAALLVGVSDVGQRQRVRRDPILSDPAIFREYPVQTVSGIQKMACIERLGIGRFLNGLSPSVLRQQVRDGILRLQWDITVASDRILWGEVDAESSAPTMLVPSKGPRAIQARRDAARLREEDIRHFLTGLADRIGPIEIASREIQFMLHIMADNAPQLLTPRSAHTCPRCGHTFSDDSDNDNDPDDEA